MPNWLIYCGLVFCFFFMLFSAFSCLVVISDKRDQLKKLGENTKPLDLSFAILRWVFLLGLFVFDLYIVFMIGKVLVNTVLW